MARWITARVAGQQRVYNSSYIPAAALRQCNTTRHATTVSQWTTQLPNLATNFAQASAGAQPHHPCSRRQSIQYNPSIHPTVRSMSPRVRTRRQGSSGYITRGTAEVRVGGWWNPVEPWNPVLQTCSYSLSGKGFGKQGSRVPKFHLSAAVATNHTHTTRSSSGITMHHAPNRAKLKCFSRQLGDVKPQPKLRKPKRKLVIVPN